MFNPTYYKSHIINQIQSPQTHELTAIVSVQKVKSNHIVATNAAQVITYLQTGHHLGAQNSSPTYQTCLSPLITNHILLTKFSHPNTRIDCYSISSKN